MQRTSTKTLSAAFSLLLAVALLFSLSLTVWADTEAVLGDLNGDTLVNADDTAILEAVLDGTQEGVAGVNYDISGNNMVDHDDLTVLKNMVDPSQPALADKLADGAADDLLELVCSVTGGQFQRAIAKGSSTRALEMSGTATVLFDAPQNWSAKSALEIDTLWLSGDRTVTVVLLGADGKTELGVPCIATAQTNGWSRLSVSLRAIASAQRAKVGGLMITVAEDAHVYMDNLSLTAAEDAYTRAELETALVEIAWDWYLKGSAYEYDSLPLNSNSQPISQPLAGYGGGKSRLTLFPTLEAATSHSSVFTVCSGFAYDIYLSAFNYPILGSKYNSLTMTFWRNSSYYPGNVLGAEGSYDMTILRWHSKGQGNIYYNYDTEFSNYYIDEGGNIVFNNWYDTSEVIDFFENYEENFRPGDIIVFDSPGHTVVYVGNGMVMHSNGTGKYNMETGEENRELDGTVTYESFEDLFLNPARTTMNLEIALGKAENHVVVLRPLNLLTIDDSNSDLSDDVLNPDYELQTGLLKYKLDFDTTTEVQTSGYSITEQTLTRLQYPGMNIDRTVNITPYGTAVKGGTLTYSVKITNNSSDAEYAAFYGNAAGETYEDLWIVEHVPANTRLVSAPNATVNGNTLRWNVDVPAGQTVELCFTVEVTGEIGDEIVCGGGWVNNIPSNTITNIIGGEKLSSVHQNAIASNGINGITSATGTDLAEQIYANATGADLQLPDVQELMGIFFSEYKYSTAYGYYLYYSSSGITRYMYTLNEEAPTLDGRIYRDMLVPGYYGGMWCYTDEYNGPARINELREEYLEVGDILVYMDLTPSTDYGATSQTRVVEGYSVLVYLGGGTFACVDGNGNVSTRTDAVAYTEAFKHDLFLCLRPSQAYEDLSAGIPSYTVTWKNGDAVLETDDTPYGQVPTYDGATPVKTVEGDIYTYTFAGWTPTVRPANGDVTYTALFTRELTDSKLTDAELNALAGITAEDVQAAFEYGALTSPNSHAALPWIYQQAGISVPTELSTNKIYATRNLLFTTSGGLAANASAAAPYTTMLVTNAYGGAQMKDGAVPGFDIGYLQIGDVFLAAFDKAQTGASATYYYTYLYQGNGNFLSISTDSAVYTYEEVLSSKYLDTEYGWSYFFVIRPEEYNNPGKRDVALRSLTAAEKYQLSLLTTSQIGFSSYHMKANVNKIYGLVGINTVIPDSYSSSTENTRDKLFTSTNPRVPLEAGDDAAKRYTQRMMVACYGGSYLANTVTLTEAIASGTLQIGDVVAGIMADDYTVDDVTKTANTQFTALYQGINAETGKGKFVIQYRDYITSTSSGGYNNATVVMYADEIDTRTATYYYTLRPDNLATASDDSVFTVTWVNDDGTVLETDENVAVLTHPTYEGATPTKAATVELVYTFAGWTPVMVPVNGDVTYKATYTAEGRPYTITWLNEDGSVLATEDVPYGSMPTYTGETPTKTGAEGYTYTFEGWDKEVVAVTGETTYTATYSYVRSLTAHKLSNAELDILANLTPEDVIAGKPGSNLDSAGPWVYQQANITYDAYETSGSRAGTVLSIYYTAAKFFSGSANAGWALRDSVSAPYTTTLVANSYGGTRMNEAYPAFDLNYLQVGDLFCGMYTYFTNAEQTTTGNIYATYLYQGKGENGEGKFLLLNKNTAAVFSLEEVLNSTYTYTDGVDYGWGCYFVIRPEEYSTPGNRDITLRSLTDAEKTALSNLTTARVGFASYHVKANVTKIYGLIGINDFMVATDGSSLTTSDIFGKLFTSSNPRVPRVATTDTMRFVQKMMVACYGGSLMADTVTLTDAVASGTLQIGDIVAGVLADAYTADNGTGSADTQFTALYQGIDAATGKGKFVILYRDYTTSASAYNSETVEMYADEIDARITSYYYTLRPSNLATVTDDSTFTVTWVNEDGTVLETDENVAALTHPSYAGAEPTKAADAEFTYTFAGWTPVMTPVNGDVTYTAVYTKTVNTYTVTWKDASGTILETDEEVPYGTVPTYHNKRPFNKNEAVGFAGWDQEIVAVTGDVTYTATFTALRDMTSGGLTDAEKAVISSLTLTDWSSNVGSRSLENVIPWVYKEAGIDITSAYGYQRRSSAQISNTLSGNSAIAKDFYTKIAVAGSYGNGVTGVGTDNLQVGDIFAGLYSIDLNGTSTTMYHAAVYLGNGLFLDVFDKVNDAGTGKTAGSVIASFADIESDYTADGFTAWSYRYVLRPSQLSIPCTVTWKNADGTVLETDSVTYGTVPTYDGATPAMTKEGYTYTFEGWDKEAAAATGDATYTATYSHIRTLTTHLLTDKEMAALAAISAEDVENAGLSGDNITNVIAWIYQQANIDISDTVLGSKTINSVKGYLFTSSPLVPRTSTSSSSAESKILYAAYIPMRVAGAYGGTTLKSSCFDIHSLQIGDLLCAHDGSYYVYLYQGLGDNNEGKFLKVGKNNYGEFTLNDIINEDKVWNYYYVIRPDHYNGRPMEDAPLTDAETYNLSMLTGSDIAYTSSKLYGTLTDYYRAVGITLDKVSTDANTHEGVRNMLFDWSESVLVPVEATNDTMRYYQKMQVAVQGGSNFAAASRVDISDAIDSDVLQIGDVIAGVHKNTYDGGTEDVPFTALYQGNDTFLVYYYAQGTMTRTQWTTEQVEALNYYYYYTLRPNNLAN